ncbi:NAD(P)-dependent oxidoreductase [Salarchaeum sp. III]|uniref:NAD-dependent epimerase/dehydratase family protein n=1 Tax=Salarchaeum sp. III TaxID=3107927 RepID=UPI002EDBA1ED
MDTVLVTGGTGFIGAHVAAEFVANDHDVVAYDTSTDDSVLRALGVADDVRIRAGDVTDAEDVATAVRESGASRIVHLAAVLSDTTETDPRAAHTVNIAGTCNVFEAAASVPGVDRLVWASSATVYAPADRYADSDETADDDWWVDEDALYDPVTLYGATKAYCEEQARVFRDTDGVDDVALRPTLVYGPHRETGSSSVFSDLVERPARGESVSIRYGDQPLAWLHVVDAARAFYLATVADASALTRRIYNVRGPLATVREAAGTVRELLDETDITVSDDGTLPWTQRLDTTAIETDLGFEPRYDLRRGFQQYIDAVRA